MKRHISPVRTTAVAALLTLVAACSGDSAPGEGTPTQPAGSNEVDVKTQMQLSTAEALQGAMEDTFTPDQVGILVNLAHQKVVAESCDGFEVDNGKFAAALAPIVTAKKSDTDGKLIHDQLLTGLGMATGAEFAIAAYDQQAYCDGARADRDDTAASNPYDIYAAPGASPSGTQTPAAVDEVARAPS